MLCRIIVEIPQFASPCVTMECGPNLEVARLQSEFGTKDLFLIYEFSYEKCYEMLPEMLSLYFCGWEKIRKIPAKFPTQDSKTFHRRASCRSADKMTFFLRFRAMLRGRTSCFVPCSRVYRRHVSRCKRQLRKCQDLIGGLFRERVFRGHAKQVVLLKKRILCPRGPKDLNISRFRAR